MVAIHRASMLFSAAAFALTLGGCNTGNAGGASDPGAVKSAIKADEKKWNAQFNSNDMEGLLSHYADDAYFIAPGVKGANGSTAIRKAYAEGLNDKNFTISFASDKIDVAASGDLAYARGHFTEKFSDPKTGQPTSVTGSYVTVYKKQQDGSWKAVEDLSAAEPGSEKPVAPGPAAKPAKLISM